jgi:DNA-binding NarL/FixJ family response regulator
LTYFCFSNTSKLSVNILLVDDHQIVVNGLKSLLAQKPEYLVKGEALNGAEALAVLAVLKIDLVLMDIDMPVMNGIEATKEIKKQFPEVKIIMLTMHDEKAMIKSMLDLGADGYLLKNSSLSELHNAIQSVYLGKQFLSDDVNSALMAPDIDKSGALSELTDREIEIIKLIAEGMSNKEIGDKLFISHRTVDTHRTNLMNKLGLHNVAGIVRFAISNGLTDN